MIKTESNATERERARLRKKSEDTHTSAVEYVSMSGKYCEAGVLLIMVASPFARRREICSASR